MTQGSQIQWEIVSLWPNVGGSRLAQPLLGGSIRPKPADLVRASLEGREAWPMSRPGASLDLSLPDYQGTNNPVPNVVVVLWPVRQ